METSDQPKQDATSEEQSFTVEVRFDVQASSHKDACAKAQALISPEADSYITGSFDENWNEA